MNIKKVSIISIILAVVLVIGTLTVFATGKINKFETITDSEISTAYKIVQQISLIDRDMSINDYHNEIERICQQNDTNIFEVLDYASIQYYDPLFPFYVNSLEMTSSEMFAETTGDENTPFYSGNVTYSEDNIYFNAGYSLEYTLLDKDRLTISERDEKIASISLVLDEHVSSIFENNLNKDLITKDNLNNILAIECSKHNNENIIITGEFYLVGNEENTLVEDANSTILLDFKESFRKPSAFINGIGFSVKEASNEILYFTLKIDTGLVMVQVIDTSSNKTLFEQSYNGRAETYKFSETLETLKPEREYIIKIIGTDITNVSVRVSKNDNIIISETNLRVADTNNPIAVATKGQSVTEEITTDYSIYSIYGVTYDENSDTLYYDNETVRYFEDFYPLGDNSFSGIDYLNTNGTVDIHGVRDFSNLIENSDGSFDPSGKLIGVEPYTQAEFDARNIKEIANTSQATALSGEPMTEQETLESFTEYAPFGLIYNPNNERLYYNGKLVRNFTDILTSNGESLESGNFSGSMRKLPNDDGEVDVYTVRDFAVLDEDGNGTLLEVNAYSDEEFKERSYSRSNTMVESTS